MRTSFQDLQLFIVNDMQQRLHRISKSFFAKRLPLDTEYCVHHSCSLILLFLWSLEVRLHSPPVFYFLFPSSTDVLFPSHSFPPISEKNKLEHSICLKYLKAILSILWYAIHNMKLNSIAQFSDIVRPHRSPHHWLFSINGWTMSLFYLFKILERRQ